MKNNWLNRTEMLIGKEKMNKLQKANVIVFGLGGVGSYAVEGLVRAGIGNITIVDKDIVDITNINRQLIADTETIGKAKVDVEKERIKKINPEANVTAITEFVDKNNIEEIMARASHDFSSLLNDAQFFKNQNSLNYKSEASTNQDLNINIANTTKLKIDYVVDAIDTVSSKLEIIKYCYINNIPLISCMGTGNKLDASKFEITDITKTSVCPLAKVIRKELRELKIPHLKVLYSKEEPIKTSVSSSNNLPQSETIKTNSTSPASISFVPSVAGLLIAGEVVRELM